MIVTLAYLRQQFRAFNSLPRSRKLRFYKVGKPMLEEKLADAMPLKIENGKVSLL